MRALICVGLALAVFGVYGRVLGFDFVNFDDPEYVTENPMVRAGLTMKGVLWAFRHTYASNWHPLTWISLMLDCQIFGLHHPGGFHLVNVVLHAANAVLLFLLLDRMTGTQWRSAIVAALFALHPMHVESVAWISERKDVLSTFFGLLALLAYVRYTEDFKVQLAALKPGEGGSSKFKVWHGLSLLLFALGLMAKPMLVTLPFVLLLLDFWPLQRVDNAGWRTFFTPGFGRLLREKWAWFALSAASCGITFYAQKTAGAMATVESDPFILRGLIAIESYCWYVFKTFWPTRLAVFYPLEHYRPIPPFIAACVFLLAVSGMAVWMLKRRPYFFVGWFWFLGTLVPVIGFVQVGAQGMADRYNYLPSIGVFIAVIWWAGELVRGSKLKLMLGYCAIAIALIALSATTFIQTGYWTDGIVLFRHAIQVTHVNDMALDDLGAALFHAHRYEEALASHEAAVRMKPGAAVYHNDLGATLAAMNRQDEALAQYAEAVRLKPSVAVYQNDLATALARSGQTNAAIEHFLAALDIDPRYAQARCNLGVFFVAQHRFAEAISNLSEAARLDPANSDVRNNLGGAFLSAGRPDDALEQYAEALRLNPTNAAAHLYSGLALVNKGRSDDALNQFDQAVRLDPGSAKAHYELGRQLFLRRQFQSAREQLAQAASLMPNDASARSYLGLACLELGDLESGLRHLAAAEQLRPQWVAPLNTQAWVLATTEDDKIRNGAEALRLAQRAAELTSHEQPSILHTLAAAYAATGQFDKAATTAKEAIQSAESLGQTNLIPEIQQAIELYRSGRPLRQASFGGN